MYGVYLIAALLVTGGAIAFIGDRLGTKVGKKRLSIFGLRPRHTSILVTIVTGICITAATFGIMSAVSENVRTALFGMEELNQRMTATETSLRERSQELADAAAQKELADADLKKSQENIAALKKEQETLRAESARLEEGNRRLLSENESLQGENHKLSFDNTQLSASNDRLQGENKELDAANEKLTGENKALGREAGRLSRGLMTMREGNIVFQAGEVLASGIVSGGQPETKIREELDALGNLAGRNVSERLGINTGAENIWFYKPEYENAIQTIEKSHKDMVVRIVAAGNLVRGEPVRTTIALYPNYTIYKNKEFILAKPVDMKNAAEAEPIVMQFLHDINGAATARGMLPDPIRGTVGVMDGAQFFSFVNKLAARRGEWVLSAYADGATDALGPLRLDLRIEPMAEGGGRP